MTKSLFVNLLWALLALVSVSQAHGNHEQVPISDDADWASRHMAEEHHISNFDGGAFFSLHDFDSSGAWTPDEILRFYGLEDESTKHVSQEKRDEVVKEVLRLVDTNGDGKIDRTEWLAYLQQGSNLPDFGLGPGHHGDDEYEYEIHHFEKYHDENTREEDLTHPEDIEHFKKHDKLADEEFEQERLDVMAIVDKNIPQKFRRSP
ncbi:MAG: hypothetical protein M1837_003207 [Sclerophora amabilis]|nr:MAG: hypothetical protein M1837_003207 [Sclerophora amabilis]